MAWYRTDLYHRVLTYSGTYVNQQWPPDPTNLSRRLGNHDHLIGQAKNKASSTLDGSRSNDLRPNGPRTRHGTTGPWLMCGWPLAESEALPHQFRVRQRSPSRRRRRRSATLPEAARVRLARLSRPVGRMLPSGSPKVTEWQMPRDVPLRPG